MLERPFNQIKEHIVNLETELERFKTSSKRYFEDGTKAQNKVAGLEQTLKDKQKALDAQTLILETTRAEREEFRVQLQHARKDFEDLAEKKGIRWDGFSAQDWMNRHDELYARFEKLLKDNETWQKSYNSTHGRAENAENAFIEKEAQLDQLMNTVDYWKDQSGNWEKKYNEIYIELQAAGVSEKEALRDKKLWKNRASQLATWLGNLTRETKENIYEQADRTTQNDMGQAPQGTEPAPDDRNVREVNGPCQTEWHNLYSESGHVCPHCEKQAKHKEDNACDFCRTARQAGGVYCSNECEVAATRVYNGVPTKEQSAADLISSAREEANRLDKSAGNVSRPGLIERIEAAEKIAERADRRVNLLTQFIEESEGPSGAGEFIKHNGTGFSQGIRIAKDRGIW